MNYFKNIKSRFGSGDALFCLIVINVAVFLFAGILNICFALFKGKTDFLVDILALPALPKAVLYRAWTVLTYTFLHTGFWHILFNMLMLYWFGKIFLIYFREKQLVGLYLIGGFFGALFFIMAYSIFPLFADKAFYTVLMGASASVTAVVVASAVQMPNMEMRLLLFGSVKLKWIALIMVLISFFGITGSNAGGEISHLGGALAGWIFVVSLRRGKDITSWINRLIDSIVSLLSQRKMKVVMPNPKKRKMTDAEFNVNKARNAEEIDRILDKIKASGYDSLSAEEKRRLFEQGRK